MSRWPCWISSTSPVQYIAPRYALEDVDLHGQRVPNGSTVMVAIASHREETVFEHPERFDITRTPNRHVAFGLGIHYCLGSPLARLEAKIAFQTLLRRYPNLKLAAPLRSWSGANQPRCAGWCACRCGWLEPVASKPVRIDLRFRNSTHSENTLRPVSM